MSTGASEKYLLLNSNYKTVTIHSNYMTSCEAASVNSYVATAVNSYVATALKLKMSEVRRMHSLCASSLMKLIF